MPFTPEEDEKADDELRALLRQKIADADKEGGDTNLGGFDAPLEASATAQTVTAEDGYELAEKSRFGERKSSSDAATDLQKAIDEGSDKATDDPAKPTPASPAVAAPAEANDYAAKPLTDLLGSLDEPARAEISRRIGRADEFDALFKGREDELKLHGDITPSQAMARMLKLNDYAQRQPDKYIAWVAKQMNPQEAHTILDSAAKLLGYKLTPDAEVGDEFEDDETKKLREDNRMLRLNAQADFGPDAPGDVAQRTIEQQIAGFATERDAAGQVLRPHYEALKAQIAGMATLHRQTTGRPVTLADLDVFYKKAEADVRQSFGLAAPEAAKATSAAQQTPPVQQVVGKTEASDVEKAKLASKSIDGTGQGADRHPALSSDATLRATLRHFMND